MPIAIKPNKSAHVRALKGSKPQLGVDDLVRETGYDRSLIRAALEHGEMRKPKSRVFVGRG